MLRAPGLRVTLGGEHGGQEHSRAHARWTGVGVAGREAGAAVGGRNGVARGALQQDLQGEGSV